jgi:hypothetical protein
MWLPGSGSRARPCMTGWPGTRLVSGEPSLGGLAVLIDMNGAAAIGLYLTLFAGIAWLVGAIWQLSTGGPEVTPQA